MNLQPFQRSNIPPVTAVELSTLSEPVLLRGWPFGMERSPIGSPVTSYRVFSQKCLRQLKTTLFGGAGVGSASE